MSREPATTPPPPLWRRLRVPIRAKVLAVLLVVASICSVVVSTTLVSFFNQDKATYIQDLNADVASNTASSVGLLLDLYQDRLLRAAELFNGADPGNGLSDFLARNGDVLYIGIYDQQRRNVLNLSRDLTLGEAGIAPEEFRAARLLLDESPAYLTLRGMVVRNSSASPDFLTFAMVVPFHATAFNTSFFVRADFRASQLQRAIERTPGLTYLVDRNGSIFLHPDPAVVASLQSFSQRAVVQAFLANQGSSAAGTGEFSQAGEEPTLASYAAVRGAGLGVLVERPKHDAYLAASRLTERSMRAAVIIFLIAAGFSLIVSRALSAPLLALARAARRLEKGDFDVRVHVATHDELGDVARSFNLAAEGLRDRDLKLKDTYDQLLQSEKLAAFGKFSAGIAHEIKNPLTGIIGFSQILARRLPEGDAKLRPLQMIEKEAKRCKSILDNLLKFTRKEGLAFEPVRLHAHLAETLDLVAPQLGVQQVEVTTSLLAPDDLVRGDPNQLRQVLMNLILNAVDAMEGRPLRRLTVSTRSGEEGFVEVLVGDTGSGISEDKIRRIFDPFFTTKEPGKGTGLGLSVSYGIITNHGGRITVRSRVEEGTEFRISLPPAPADVRAADRVREGRLPSGAAPVLTLVGAVAEAADPAGGPAEDAPGAPPPPPPAAGRPSGLTAVSGA